jgi:MGT family glycosyltransferase
MQPGKNKIEELPAWLLLTLLKLFKNAGGGIIMKTILFFSFPEVGHINPNVEFCKELTEKDVKLIYYSFDKYLPKFAGMGNIELRKYPDSVTAYYNEVKDERKLSKLMFVVFYFCAVTEKLLPFTMEEVDREKPDLIICDPFAMWAKIASRYYHIPIAYFFSIMMMGDAPPTLPFILNITKSMIFDFGYMLKSMKIQKRIDQKYGNLSDKPDQITSHQGKFTMVMTSREFHPNGNTFPNNVKFVGPAYIDDCAIPNKKNIIFISRGTMTPSDKFWDTCIKAMKGLDYQVVISFGGNKNNKIRAKNIPDNIKIYDNLTLEEYRNILKQSLLLISHGGFNGINDAILYKTPLLICPVLSEQIGNGEFIQQYGCGVTYGPKKVTANELRKKIIEVINNESIQVNLEKYRQSFLNSMGYKKVVEELGKEFNLF